MPIKFIQTSLFLKIAFNFSGSNEFNSIYQGVNILENKNVDIKNNKLKISYLFIAYSTLLMESLGISPVEAM